MVIILQIFIKLRYMIFSWVLKPIRIFVENGVFIQISQVIKCFDGSLPLLKFFLILSYLTWIALLDVGFNLIVDWLHILICKR